VNAPGRLWTKQFEDIVLRAQPDAGLLAWATWPVQLGAQTYTALTAWTAARGQVIVYLSPGAKCRADRARVRR